MAGAFRFDTYPRDWLTGTRGLKLDARAVYWDLCCIIYEHGGPVPHDEEDLRKIIGISRVTQLRKILDYLVVKRKIWIVDGYIGNDRAILELAKRADFVTQLQAPKFNGTGVEVEISRVLSLRKTRERKAVPSETKQLVFSLAMAPASSSPSSSKESLSSIESLAARGPSAVVAPRPRAKFTSTTATLIQAGLKG